MGVHELPEDVALMYKSDFSVYQLTPESIRLWEQHTRDYLKAVQQGPPSVPLCVERPVHLGRL